MRECKSCGDETVSNNCTSCCLGVLNILADHGVVSKEDMYFVNRLIENGRSRKDKKVIEQAILIISAIQEKQ